MRLVIGGAFQGKKAYVAEKYHGSMKQQIREEKEGSVYSLEVLVFTE